MEWSVLVVVIATISSVAGSYQWSDWDHKVDCPRLCSEPSGVATYSRQCVNCTRENNCQAVSNKYCQGASKKNDSCYVATECEGDGPYVGQWTEWHTAGKCPPSYGACRGLYLKYSRSCVLPPAYTDRSRLYGCPGAQTFSRAEPCRCSDRLWSEWLEWSACVDPCADQRRMRFRFCSSSRRRDCEGGRVQIGRCPVSGARCPAATVRRLVRRDLVNEVWKDKLEDLDLKSKLHRTGIEAEDVSKELTDLPPWVVPAVILGIIAVVSVLAVCCALIGKCCDLCKDKKNEELVRTPLIASPSKAITKPAPASPSAPAPATRD